MKHPTELTAFLASVRDEAADWDSQGELPDHIRKSAAQAGLFGVGIPEAHGGTGGTAAGLGELSAETGGVCSALRGLLTVQGMVAAALLRWGTAAQRERWLPPLARGDLFAAFAATEEGAGTELSAVRTRVERDGEHLVVTGRKRWITFGRSADVFLVLGVLEGEREKEPEGVLEGAPAADRARAPGTGEGRPVAVLVDGDLPGVVREPVEGQLGMRAAGIAHVSFDAVRIPADRMVAPPGLGLSHVIGTALDHGRFTVAWGCVGMAEACLDTAAAHAARRTQGGVPLAAHQVIRAQLGRAVADTAAARALCARAAAARDEGRPDAVTETVVAKYAAARAASAVSAGAVQTLGSAAMEPDSQVGRFFRDAKVMELIEGSVHITELRMADRLLRRHGYGHGTERSPR